MGGCQPESDVSPRVSGVERGRWAPQSRGAESRTVWAGIKQRSKGAVSGGTRGGAGRGGAELGGHCANRMRDVVSPPLD